MMLIDLTFSFVYSGINFSSPEIMVDFFPWFGVSAQAFFVFLKFLGVVENLFAHLLPLWSLILLLLLTSQNMLSSYLSKYVFFLFAFTSYKLIRCLDEVRMVNQSTHQSEQKERCTLPV